ncbi:LytR C-terminal domain-containing protein [Streptomyces sp. WMMB 322]|uniref:LytR C-terminal domain-containing protein n=1 Tax=Streptomyces sp. WMMB 322 TaxID=1286821 RepID=UPI000823DCF7|nr:LytR C-terminal domain-containing protein [Streptomyces sp. WMMB 322]SCK12470.1 LytR cell envelope-related transcriptional attenuator [Streptomyces sp. WMMB 322]
MSMLTPPGMGGKYRITGNRYPRMRRPRNRRRIVLASLTSVCVLSLGGWGTLQLIDIFSGGTSANAAGSSSKGKEGADCAPETNAEGQSPKNDGKQAEYPEPGAVEVNVLNATDRSGLARSIADELKKRGFKIGEVKNAPAEFDKKVENTGILMGAQGEDGDARLKVLSTQFAEDPETRFDDRKGEDVDFIIGKKYEKLVKEKEADAALTALYDPKPSPSRSHCKD